MVHHLKKAIINLQHGVSSYEKLSAISTMVYHLTKSYHQPPTWCITLQKAISYLHHGVSSYKKAIINLHYGVSSYKAL
jgi:hypothetical protein